jgi:3-hydroxyisobutyrate dehydrogenase-like beta-hydroxyacid dehydrogenase
LLITCLANDEALQGHVDTLAKMLAHGGSGLTLIDLSPVLPATMADVSARLDKCGVAALGAALITSADGKEVTLFVDGTVESVESVRSLLTEFSATVIPTGEPGTSKVMRILERLLVGVNTVAAAEAIALAHRVGLAANTLIPLILKGSGASAVLADGYGPAPSQGSLLQKHSIRSMRSDLDAALSLGRRHNHTLFFAALSLNAYRGASALGLDDEDCSATIRWFHHAACFDGVERKLDPC